jgi:hypothetical protein
MSTQLDINKLWSDFIDNHFQMSVAPDTIQLPNKEKDKK